MSDYFTIILLPSRARGPSRVSGDLAPIISRLFALIRCHNRVSNAIIVYHYTRLWLAWFWIISRLFALGRWHSVAIIVFHFTLLWQAWLWWNNANNAETNKIEFNPTKIHKMVNRYALLCAIIHEYVTIMPIIAIIVIMLFFQKSYSRVYFLCENFLSKTNIRYGQHTEGIMLAKNPIGLINSVGHGHGLVVPDNCTRCSTNRRDVSGTVCDERRWHAVNRTRSYSGRIWSPMLLATVKGRRVSLFPHFDACCESLSSGCNFPPVAKCLPMAKILERNTIQKEGYAQPCA